MPVSRKSKKNLSKKRKTRKHIRKMRGGGNKQITDSIYLAILDTHNSTDEEYINFVNLYNKDTDTLCYKKKGEGEDKNSLIKTQSLHNYLVDIDHLSLRKEPQYKFIIIYLYEETQNIQKHIIAFAAISCKLYNNIITLDVLCSHKDKKYKINKNGLGIYLLNYLYDNFNISNGALLKIQAATPDLIPYYTKWKQPIISPSPDNLIITQDYLIYCNIALVEDSTLQYLFRDELRRIQNITQHLGNIKIPKELQKIDKIKKFLVEITNQYEFDDEGTKEQILYLISLIKYLSLEDIKSKLFI